MASWLLLSVSSTLWQPISRRSGRLEHTFCAIANGSYWPGAVLCESHIACFAPRQRWSAARDPEPKFRPCLDGWRVCTSNQPSTEANLIRSMDGLDAGDHLLQNGPSAQQFSRSHRLTFVPVAEPSQREDFPAGSHSAVASECCVIRGQDTYAKVL